MNLLVALIAKTAVPLVVALVIVRLMSRRSAALRHSVLAAAVLSTLAMPLLQPIAPGWAAPMVQRGVPTGVVSPVAALSPVSLSEATAPSVGGIEPASPDVPSVKWTSIVAALWILGTLAGLATLAVGFMRLSRLNADCETLLETSWTGIAADVARHYRITTRIRLRESRSSRLLVAFGWWRPAVLLPPGAAQWTAERVRIVLAHELAHIHRRDWVTQLAAEALRAMLWFNPLAWIVVRRLRDESERACDDLVLDSGIDAADYAETLAVLARALQPSRNQWVPAPAMARASTLERRVTAMLDTNLNRSRPRRAVRLLVTASLVALAVAVAGFGVAAQSFSTVTGQTRDTNGGTIGNVTLALVNQTTGQKYEIKSGATGRYEMVGVIAGDYRLKAVIPGFKMTELPLTVAARTVTQDITMTVGEVEETITVTNGGSQRVGGNQRVASDGVKFQPGPACVPSAGGGMLTPPTKTLDVRPGYPPELSAANVGEVIEFDAMIATDGAVREANVVGTPANPELVASAEEAIRQWRFTPTLLNCAPIEVKMRVHVRFAQR